MKPSEYVRLGASYVALGWTQFASARNTQGESVHSDDPHAVAWCSMGGMYRGFLLQNGVIQEGLIRGGLGVVFSDDWSCFCKKVDAYLRTQYPKYDRFYRFNDAPNRTKEGVLLFMRQMQLAFEEEERQHDQAGYSLG